MATRQAKTLQLQDDALDWLAEGLPGTRTRRGRLKISRIAQEAGIHQQTLNRVAAGETVHPDPFTVGALVELAMRLHNVPETEAIGRLLHLATATKVTATPRPRRLSSARAA